MYRFRSVENLLGEFQELERQQIYFAPLDELNDPMEGTRNYFWKGDRIVWENFLKHFLLCLDHIIVIARLSSDDKRIQKSEIPIYMSEMRLPTDQYRRRIAKINERFFSDSFVQGYMTSIINNPNKIYARELYVHLKIIFHVALEVIHEVDLESGMYPRLSKIGQGGYRIHSPTPMCGKTIRKIKRLVSFIGRQWMQRMSY